jgi:hypothetical protein
MKPARTLGSPKTHRSLGRCNDPEPSSRHQSCPDCIIATPGYDFREGQVHPGTILRWHRASFKVFWRWKSRNRTGRPKIDRGLRDLIQRMSMENPLWGAPRIHGELLKLGFEVAQSTVSKYMVRVRNPPSQTWKTFLRNHAEAIAAIDMCVVPTVTFDLLFAFLVLGHGRRQLLWFEVTRHPTAEWLARQITEAFPWASAPAYLVRDNDRHGYSRPADLAWIALAKWLCGTLNRHIAPRVPGPNRHFQRGTPTANSFRLCDVLQSSAHALGITERYAVASSRPTVWRHCSHSDLGRAASSIRPDMIFGKDRCRSAAFSASS